MPCRRDQSPHLRQSETTTGIRYHSFDLVERIVFPCGLGRSQFNPVARSCFSLFCELIPVATGACILLRVEPYTARARTAECSADGRGSMDEAGCVELPVAMLLDGPTTEPRPCCSVRVPSGTSGGAAPGTRPMRRRARSTGNVLWHWERLDVPGDARTRFGPREALWLSNGSQARSRSAGRRQPSLPRRGSAARRPAPGWGRWM